MRCHPSPLTCCSRTAVCVVQRRPAAFKRHPQLHTEAASPWHESNYVLEVWEAGRRLGRRLSRVILIGETGDGSGLYIVQVIQVAILNWVTGIAVLFRGTRTGSTDAVPTAVHVGFGPDVTHRLFLILFLLFR
jgi:hypothetical protein